MTHLAHLHVEQLETILKHALLQNKQSVEMYAKDAGTGAWSLSKRASPGNLQSFEDLLFHRGEQTDNALVMAARLVTSADSKVQMSSTQSFIMSRLFIYFS